MNEKLLQRLTDVASKEETNFQLAEASHMRNDQTAFSDHIVDISNNQGPSTSNPQVKELVQNNMNEDHKVVTFDETANEN